jgi:hypothetical protein
MIIKQWGNCTYLLLRISDGTLGFLLLLSSFTAIATTVITTTTTTTTPHSATAFFSLKFSAAFFKAGKTVIL